jgi:hypothetical protein
MIRKLKDGRYPLYSRTIDPRTGKRRNLGTFATRETAERHERAVEFFKRRGSAGQAPGKGPSAALEKDTGGIDAAPTTIRPAVGRDSSRP